MAVSRDQRPETSTPGHLGANTALLRRTDAPPHKLRGRPPGINADRRDALAQMARGGFTLAEMAAALGVTRQCVHAQLAKCADLHAERQARRNVRQHHERAQHLWVHGLEWAREHAAGGNALVRFLRTARELGWSVEAAPRRRPCVNGTRLAFHLPRRLRRASGTTTSGGTTRYYHVQLTRPEWLHVVCLPTGRYVFYLPDQNRHRGSYYIPEAMACAPQTWPEWPGTDSTARRAPKPQIADGDAVERKRAERKDAWAA